ncbi:hypothetical protein [Dysgonomonas sp. Marseille-Q5470]|uniref:hypothetical protein n=1 Tax=Dysgonomonas sp. Marseille-Q5470 TaxID=3039494 RepID=UPI0024BD3FEB|nr:hypothetical protein [Dysgonomonas sp. Marseille-Q5470]MBS5979697.1 hypothetical protein [Dysgonomonas mossii]
MNKLESVVDGVQQFANLCIRREYELRSYSFSAKLEHLNEKQRQTVVDSELLKAADELMLIIRHSPILQSVADHTDSPNFLWDSTFIEILSTDEKKKYTRFNTLSLDFATYAGNTQIYDAELPYFSSVIEYAVLVRYINYLKRFVQEEDLSEPVTPEEPEIKIEKPEQSRNFESKFEDWQIDILTECVNEVRIFSTSISSQTMTDILSCKLKEPLRVAKNKNKLLAYLFYQLDTRSYIVRDWQAVCAKNELFISSGKGIILQQANFSSAVSQNNESPPKDCHIIDKYIKELKRD